MNIANMRVFFQISWRTRFFLRSRTLGLCKMLAFVTVLAFVTPALALVGPAREAPEFAPYAVMVLNKSDGSFCSASVITQDIVLTAAHCVMDVPDTQVFFREGSRLVWFDIASIAVHPEFRPNIGRRHLISIDLALLRLAAPLPSAFKPVELTDSGAAVAGQPFRIAGFGLADESVRGTSGILREGILAVSGPKSPVLVWLTDPDGTGLGSCTGDSGAPVFAVDRPALIAVAIRAKGNNGHFCGAMTEAVRIGPQMPWLRKTLQAWEAAGSQAH